MGLTTKFLVDSTNYKQILEAIKSDDNQPDRIDKEYFEELGYTKPTDFIVLSFLVDLQLIDEDGIPTDLFEKFQNKETSDEALAKGVIHAYEDLFKVDSSIYSASTDEIIEVIQENLDSEISYVILNYMAKTFKVLVNYVGPKNIKKAWEQREPEISTSESVVQVVENKQSANGRADNNQSYATETSVAELEEETDTVSEEEESEESTAEVEETITEKEDAPMDKDVDVEIDLKETEAETNDQDLVDVMSFVDNDENEKSSRNKNSNTEDETPQVASSSPEPQEEATKTATRDTSAENDPFSLNGDEASKRDSNTPKMQVNGMNQEISNIDKAYIKKAALLQKLERNEEALSALDEVYHRYGNSNDPTLQIHASLALVNQMKTAEKLSLNTELLPLYSEVIERLENSDDQKFIGPVDHAFSRRAEILYTQNHDQKALDAINAAIQRFNKSGRNLNNLSTLMYIKAELLEELHRDEEAVLAYEKFINRFGKNNPAV